MLVMITIVVMEVVVEVVEEINTQGGWEKGRG